MKLRYSRTSPFVRKVLLVACIKGLDSRLERETTNAWAADTDLPTDNPLCKVPALVTDDGVSLYDSPVICDYLDSLDDGPRLCPAAGPARWNALRRQALADGLLDAAVQLRVETVMRPADLRWPGWIDRQTTAILRALEALEGEATGLDGLTSIGEIAIAAALGYLDFRNVVGAWRSSRPRLAAWFDSLGQHPAMVATAPSE